MTSTYDFSGVNVLCDNDATLVDSEIIAMPHAIESVFAYFDALGLTPNVPVSDREKYAVEWAGKQISQMFAIVEEWTGHKIGQELLDQLCADDADRVIEALKEVKVIAGIPEALAELRDGGATLSVVTSSSLLRVVPGLENNSLVEFFATDGSEPRIWSAKESLEEHPKYGRAIPKSAEHPEIYELALEFTGADPKKVVAIEDSGSGLGAAVALGIPVIGLTAASHIADEDKQAHGQKLIDKASEVLGRPATEADIIIVHDPAEIPSAIGRILNLPVVARKVEGAELKASSSFSNSQLGNR